MSDVKWYKSRIFVLFLSLEEPQQDGGVDGRVLIFSCKSSKFTTCFWTTINRGLLDLTKRRYPTSKGKVEAPARW